MGAFAEIEQEKQELDAEYREFEKSLIALNEDIRRDSVILLTGSGSEVELSLDSIIDAWKPNDMNGLEMVGHYFRKGWAFIVEDPREANTEGGIFPAIFGTVLMVLLMTVVVAPFGVVAGCLSQGICKAGSADPHYPHRGQ